MILFIYRKPAGKPPWPVSRGLWTIRHCPMDHTVHTFFCNFNTFIWNIWSFFLDWCCRLLVCRDQIRNRQNAAVWPASWRVEAVCSGWRLTTNCPFFSKGHWFSFYFRYRNKEIIYFFTYKESMTNNKNLGLGRIIIFIGVSVEFTFLNYNKNVTETTIKSVWDEIQILCQLDLSMYIVHMAIV